MDLKSLLTVDDRSTIIRMWARATMYLDTVIRENENDNDPVVSSYVEDLKKERQMFDAMVSTRLDEINQEGYQLQLN